MASEARYDQCDPPRRQAQSRAHRRIEFGQRDPTLSALEKIAAAFKVNVERLLE